MNKPIKHIADDLTLIPVRDYAATYYSRRGFPVTVAYIYKLIELNKKEGKVLPFNYIDKGKEGIWIVSN